MKKKINVALVGSNFALRGYLPVIKKINQLNLKIICSRNIYENINKKILSKDIKFEKKWEKIFTKEIDLIICAVPPIIQEKILIYNLKYKKKIIFEKPISTSYIKSKYIIKKIKEKKIACSINLTFIFHPLFIKVKDFIKQKTLGKVIKYEINWSFMSQDLNKKIKSWKTQEKLGGGIKNIFLTHVFSYCQFLFGKNILRKHKFKSINFKRIKYKKNIYCELKNPKSVSGKINVFVKKKGYQSHNVKIFFEKGYLELSSKSRDWTKNFKLKIHHNTQKKIKTVKLMNKQKFPDGRSTQIHYLFAKFLKKFNYTNVNYALNAEKINNKIN